MTVASENEGKKWIQASLAVACIFLGYIISSFLMWLSERLLLESKIPYFSVAAQFAGVVIGVVAFIYILKNPKSSEFLADVYKELLKVVWPDKNQTWKYTVVIMILVTIMGFVFGLFDLGANFLLGLVNK